jgi:hypothetical protein
MRLSLTRSSRVGYSRSCGGKVLLIELINSMETRTALGFVSFLRFGVDVC